MILMFRHSSAHLVILSLIALVISGSYVTASWNVEWYTVNEDSYKFEDLLGKETWPTGDFSYDWAYTDVFSTSKDYVGFIATTDIYANGDTYKISLFDVNDEATVYIDGREVLSYNELTDMLDRKSTNVDLTYGRHELQIEFIEACCQASIGFSAENTLFDITLMIGAEPHSGGYVRIIPPKDTYDYEETVTLVAMPFTNYRFDFWSGDSEGYASNISIIMDSDKKIIAHFYGNNPPSIAITSHSQGSKVTGSFKLKGISSDVDGNDNIQLIEVRIDNSSWRAASGTTNWDFEIDANTLEHGLHELFARAYDGKNYSGISSITIEVGADNKTVSANIWQILGVIGVIFVLKNWCSKKTWNS